MRMRVRVQVERIRVGRINQTTARRRTLLVFYIGQNQSELRQCPLKTFHQVAFQQFRKIDIQDIRTSHGMRGPHDHLPGMQPAGLARDPLKPDAAFSVHNNKFAPPIFMFLEHGCKTRDGSGRHRRRNPDCAGSLRRGHQDRAASQIVQFAGRFPG